VSEQQAERRQFLYGLVAGLLVGLAGSVLNPLLSYFGEGIRDWVFPPKAHLSLEFIRHESDGGTRMLVSNSGERAAWIERVDFCEAAALSMTVEDGSTIYAWDYAKKKLDYNNKMKIHMAAFGQPIPPELDIDCSRHYGPEPLPLISSNRMINPGEAIEVLVRSPSGFSLVSAIDRGGYGFNLACLATLVTVEDYLGARRLIPCFPDNPEGYEKRWQEYVERHARKEPQPAPTPP